MNKDWLTAVTGYANLKEMNIDRAHQLAVLLWFSENMGPVEGFEAGKYPEFSLALSGKKPYKGRWVKSETKTKGTTRPDDDPTSFSFEEFWKMYAFAKGSKRDAQTIWNKLTESDRLAVRDTLLIYVGETVTSDQKATSGKFMPMRKHPVTYLNQKVWETYMDRVKEVEQEQMNMDVLDGIFAKLDVSTGYMIAPDRQDLLRALSDFNTSVNGYVERHLVAALQDHYTEKGKFAGKLPDVLRSQDFRTSYLSRT